MTSPQKTPYEIAQDIFTKEPLKPFSKSIELSNTNEDVSYLFEIILNIMMEGMEILTGGLDKTDFTNFNKELILIMNPWLASLGLKVNVQLETETIDYYCKIIINNDDWKHFFNLKKISNTFHFLLSPKYASGTTFTKLNEHHAIFKINKSIYRINFDIIH
jgi:hypothetical protein